MAYLNASVRVQAYNMIFITVKIKHTGNTSQKHVGIIKFSKMTNTSIC